MTNLDGVQAVRVIELEPASRRWPHTCDLLVELDLAPDMSPPNVIDTSVGIELLGDMQLLGMAPTVAVIGSNRTTTL